MQDRETIYLITNKMFAFSFFIIFVASTMTQPVINGVTAVIPSHLERSVYFSGRGELISMLGVCDGTPDCSTAEDELNCTQPEGLIMRLRGRQPTILVSDQVRHKPSCTATEASYNTEISDLKRRDIY